MKKFLFVPIFIIMSVLLSSCINLGDIKLGGTFETEGDNIEAMSDEIIRCLTDDDKEAFKELFCEKVRDTDDFDEQVDEVFDFFECEIYTMSDYDRTASGGSSIENGEKIDWYVSPDITYIQTLVTNPEDEDDMIYRWYGVHYYYQITYAENEKLEGLHAVSIALLNFDEDKITAGTYDYVPE